MQVVSRDDARARGLPRYFSGKPCMRGHVAERYTASNGCLACLADPARRAAAVERVRDWRKHNRDKHREHSRKWRERDPERARRVVRKSKKGNPEVTRRWYRENREAVIQKVRDWRKENPEMWRAQIQKRRAWKLQAEGTHTAADIRAMYKRQRGRCLNCGESIRSGYHVDHIMPLARGGSNGPENLQLLCPPCNISKGAKCPIEWAQENGRLL